MPTPVGERHEQLDGKAFELVGRDAAVQAFGAIAAFLENGDEEALSFSLQFFIKSALGRSHRADVIRQCLSELAQFAAGCRARPRRDCEQRLTAIIDSCLSCEVASTEGKAIK